MSRLISWVQHRFTQGFFVGRYHGAVVLPTLLFLFFFNYNICASTGENSQSTESSGSTAVNQESQLLSNAQLNLTAEEKAFLEAHPTISVIDDFAWPPYTFLDENGEFSGIASSYLNLCAAKLGIEFQPQFGYTWEEALERVKSGKADLIPLIIRTPEREEFLSFTQPFISFPIVLASHVHSPFIDDLKDLDAKRVGVVKGYLIEKQLTKEYPKLQVVPYVNVAAGLEGLSAGEVDAFAGNLGVIVYEKRRLLLDELKIAAPTPYTDELSLGIRKDWPQLVSILNKALDSISNQEKAAIKNNWMGVTVQLGTPLKRILGWAIPVLVTILSIIAFVIIWNRRLSIEVIIRKEAEAKLKEAKEEAEKANSAKSEFLANMSHEIRTPMNAVLGFTEILKSLEKDQEKFRYIENIHTSGKALLNLIDDILDLSKIDAGKLELQYNAVNIQNLLKQLHAEFSQKIANKGLQFTIEQDPAIPSALVLDETRLRQVLINLIGNAVKFTDSGQIKLCAMGQVSDTHTQNRYDLALEVRDTGIGIPQDQQEEIFGAFKQTAGQKTSQFGGTGLGLAITRRLVTMMDGTVTVESKEGAGSTFRIHLPGVEVAATGALSQTETELNSGAIFFRSATILVTDDIDFNREMLMTYLDGMNFSFIEADNGQECLEQARLHRPDLILLDMKMPLMDGYEASELLKADMDLKEIPVIAVTASALKQDQEFIAKLCDGYLSKPVRKADLVRELMRFLPHEEG